jgi:Uma2 family endonuclease
MATEPIFDSPVTVEEYLSTAYEHDCEYVDGVIEERDLSEFEHAYIQGLLIGLFVKNRDAWGVYPLAEQRIHAQKTRFRVPDIAILREGSIREPILTHPPLLAIEVQSPDIPLRKTELKSAEYLAFGIQYVWVVDPWSRAAWRATADGLELVRSGELSIPDTPIRIVLSELFAELDRV